MHIEVFEVATPKSKQGWYWHFKSKGRITADSEAFPSKAHAMRAAKAVVTAVCKRTGTKALFTATLKGDVYIITWV